MKKCKACKEEIDSKASKCPKCGTDQRGFIKKHPLFTVILTIFILGLIASSGENSSLPSNSSKQSNNEVSEDQNKNDIEEQEADTNTKQTTPEIVSASQLVEDYDKNKLAADEKYSGKLIQTTAFITNISGGTLGQYYISLKPTAEEFYLGTSLNCYFSNKDELTKLENGQEVTITGTMDEMSIGTITIKNCTLLN